MSSVVLGTAARHSLRACQIKLHAWPAHAQRYLQAAYEDYTARDSASRVPPIPTVVVDIPGSPREQALLCYSEKRFVATEAHLDAVMRALFNAALLLEDALPPDGDVRFVQVGCLLPTGGAATLPSSSVHRQ